LQGGESSRFKSSMHLQAHNVKYETSNLWENFKGCCSFEALEYFKNSSQLYSILDAVLSVIIENNMDLIPVQPSFLL